MSLLVLAILLIGFFLSKCERRRVHKCERRRVHPSVCFSAMSNSHVEVVEVVVVVVGWRLRSKQDVNKPVLVITSRLLYTWLVVTSSPSYSTSRPYSKRFATLLRGSSGDTVIASLPR